MNLYKIKFSHSSPKDTECGIKCLLLAKNDEQVYEWIKSEPDIGGEKLWNIWADIEDSNNEFKHQMIQIKGEINDDDFDYSDAYYGITLLGWSLLKEDIKTDYSELIDLDIIKKA